jgi:hypothetical protein
MNDPTADDLEKLLEPTLHILGNAGETRWCSAEKGVIHRLRRLTQIMNDGALNL